MQYKFYKYENNPNGSDYCFCQRPCDSNMSLRCFLENGEIYGFMSESLVCKHEDIKEIDMNEFMYNFVRPLLKRKKGLVDYLKYQINECKLTGNDEDYIRADVYEEVLSKIEKSDK